MNVFFLVYILMIIGITAGYEEWTLSNGTADIAEIQGTVECLSVDVIKLEI